MGDRLATSGNSLATPMTFRYRGAPLDWQALPSMSDATGKVLVLIHGLCMNDLQRHTRNEGQIGAGSSDPGPQTLVLAQER
jgi:hypothetical protein